MQCLRYCITCPELLPEQIILFLLPVAQAFRGSIFGAGSGPIFLDRLDCSGSETALLLCSKFGPVGLYQCDHSNDAGVRCQGELLTKRMITYISHL